MSAGAVPATLPRPALVARARAQWSHVALAGVLAVAAVLDLVSLGQNGYANEYYSAAVRSMTRSWHDFVFASFDPGGLVSVDKPPLALWVSALSAKAFGFGTWQILVPEALAGIAAVWLLHLLVARYFGRVAGLVAALALAVSPVSVSVNRDNNPDALFCLLLVAAAYAGARAVEGGRLRWLVACAVAVGLAFDTKMLAAGIVVPGIAVAYVWLAPRARKVRAIHLGVAGLVLAVVGGAWIALVELTPATDRPYVGSTDDNSALSLALGYNGLGRVTGQEGGTSFGGGGGLGGAFSGAPGWLRLLNDAMGDQGGWLLPLALAGGLSLAWALLRARRTQRRELGAFLIVGAWAAAAAVVFSFSSGIIHTYYISALAPASSALVGAGAVRLARDARAGGLRLLAPLAGIGLTLWAQLVLLDRSGYLPWLQTLAIGGAALAAAAVGLAHAPVLRTPALRAGLAAGAVGVATAAFLAAPAAWSATTLEAPVNGVFPGAGPSFVSGLSTSGGRGFGFPGGGGGRGFPGGGPPRGGFGGGGGPGGAFRGGFGGGGFRGGPGGSSGDVEGALAYAKAHGGTTRFTLILQSEQSTAPHVIRGLQVAAMGGFTGRETVLTNAYLARLIRRGEARYFLLGAGGGFGGGFGSNNAAVNLVTAHCTEVPASRWSTASADSGSTSLYDCAGKADAILAAGKGAA